MPRRRCQVLLKFRFNGYLLLLETFLALLDNQEHRSHNQLTPNILLRNRMLKL